MSRSKSLLRYGGFLFSVGSARVAGTLLSALTFPYLVRRLGVGLFGLWSYVVACCSFAASVANPGLHAYAAQQLASRRKEAFGLIPDIVALRILATLVAIVLLLGFSFFEKNALVRNLLRFYGCGVLIVGLTSCDHLLAALEMFHVRSALSVIQQTLYAIGVFLLVRGRQDIAWLAISILVSALLSNIAGWTFLWKQDLKLSWNVHVSRWWRIMVPSGHYATSALMSNLYHRSGHLLVRWFLGAQALGLYSAAVRFLETIQQFSALVLSVAMPRLAAAANSPAQFARIARFGLTLIAVVNLPLALGLFSTAHLIVPWVLGSQYLKDVPLLIWMSPYLMVAPASSLLTGTILYAMGRHRAYLASTASGAVAGVILYLTLIPLFGLKGAAIAFVIGQCCVAVTAYILLPRDLHSLWRNPNLGVAALSSLVMVIIVRIVNTRTSRPAIVLASGALAYASICFWPMKNWLMREFKS